MDSTPLYDAVATMDTITLIRSALRGLLVADAVFEAELRGALSSGDDYASSAKPQIDWDDPDAREELIDSAARDGSAVWPPGRPDLGPAVLRRPHCWPRLSARTSRKADGAFRIARRVAPDRVISTVDPEARHGHKTSARGFDGYKGRCRRRPRQRDHHRHRGDPATPVTQRRRS